jgi:hypothetical protein
VKNNGQKTEVIALRLTPQEKSLLEKRCNELAEALNMPKSGAYGVTVGAVIKYCLWDSLKMLPAESVNRDLIKLKSGRI